MTLREAIDRIDDLKTNTYEDEHKARWISELDARIYNEMFLTHEGNPYTRELPKEEDEDVIVFGKEEQEEKIYLELPYDVENASEITLLAEFPHDEMYVAYLEAKIDEYNGETTRYNNSSIKFNNLYTDYCCWYNRVHMPIERGKYAAKKPNRNPSNKR